MRDTPFNFYFWSSSIFLVSADLLKEENCEFRKNSLQNRHKTNSNSAFSISIFLCRKIPQETDEYCYLRSQKIKKNSIFAF